MAKPERVHVRLPGTEDRAACQRRHSHETTTHVPALVNCKACLDRLRKYPQLAAQILAARNLVIPGVE